jgi:drug/metabolite transporter (DMT)-like permease
MIGAAIERSATGSRRGVGAALLAGVLFGASTPLAKRLVGAIAPVELAGLLYLGSGFGLLIVFLVRRAFTRAGPGPASVARAATGLRRGDFGWLAAAIASGGILAPLLLMIGLRVTLASAASLLLNLEGVFTVLLAWFVFRENFDRRVAAGMVLIVAGGFILCWQGTLVLTGSLGPLAVLGACACWAVDNNLTQKVSGADPRFVACVKGLVAGGVNVLIALEVGVPRITIADGAWALAVGFVGYGLSLALFVAALRQIGTARTSAYFSLAPFVGAVAATLFLHETFTTSMAVSGCLMAAGVWLHLTERHDHAHVHERLVHSHVHVHDEHHRHDHAPGVDAREPHLHEHEHAPLTHSHRHYPDLHHRHAHPAQRD